MSDRELDSLRELDVTDPGYASQFVNRLLLVAFAWRASDIHLQPVSDGVWIRCRVDGVLQSLGTFSAGESSDVITRLKVVANLLTYRHDVPQEGRIQSDELGFDDRAIQDSRAMVEMRLCTIPTLHGERAVIRLFAAEQGLDQLNDLGFSADVEEELERLLGETSGMILVTGPAGSGKTTSCYAALRHIAEATTGRRSIVSIEDPIEVAIAQIAQSQVNLAAGFDLSAGLKALLRQDPEVVMVSEVRDAQTATLALGASLTGHLVLGSFHASNAATAFSRLADMGVEPYVLRSGVLGIISQRLARQLCDCSEPIKDEQEKLGLPVSQAWRAVGCEKCDGNGYQGRTLIAELLLPDRGELGKAILDGADANRLQQLAVEAGMITCQQRAFAAIEAGTTSPAEVRRVFGYGDPTTDRKVES